jgi:hypothetical protein
MEKALLDFLKMAGVPCAQREVWFSGCTVTDTTLYAPTKAQAEDIARLFGAQLKQHRPNLHLRVAAPSSSTEQPPGYLNAAGRKAWKGEQRQAAQQQDLIDTSAGMK